MNAVHGITFLIFVTFANSARVFVDSQYGRIVGESFTLHNGKTVNRFHGIPYAKPPVGPLRFKVSVRKLSVYLDFLTKPVSKIVEGSSWPNFLV